MIRFRTWLPAIATFFLGGLLLALLGSVLSARF